LGFWDFIVLWNFLTSLVNFVFYEFLGFVIEFKNWGLVNLEIGFFFSTVSRQKKGEKGG
jgi:hypothetical protein